jgi:hypothetical protein
MDVDVWVTCLNGCGWITRVHVCGKRVGVLSVLSLLGLHAWRANKTPAEGQRLPNGARTNKSAHNNTLHERQLGTKSLQSPVLGHRRTTAKGRCAHTKSVQGHTSHRYRQVLVVHMGVVVAQLLIANATAAAAAHGRHVGCNASCWRVQLHAVDAVVGAHHGARGHGR